MSRFGCTPKRVQRELTRSTRLERLASLFLVLPMTAASEFNLMLVFMRCDCEHWGVPQVSPQLPLRRRLAAFAFSYFALNSSFTGSLPITRFERAFYLGVADQFA